MINLQVETASNQLPGEAQIQQWVQRLMDEFGKDAELSLRIVDEDEAKQLNQKFRGKPYATNVLSFPFDDTVPLEIPYLGDIVICAQIVEQEAAQQEKSIQAHYAHMIVHGVLHLLGYDHVNDNSAQEMESLEIELLSKWGFANPYHQSMV